MFTDTHLAEEWLFKQRNRIAAPRDNDEVTNEEVTLDQYLDNSFKSWKWFTQSEFHTWRKDQQKEIADLRKQLSMADGAIAVHLSDTIGEKKKFLTQETAQVDVAKKKLTSEYHQTRNAVCTALKYEHGKYRARMEYNDEDGVPQSVTELVSFSWMLQMNVGKEWIAYLKSSAEKKGTQFVHIPPSVATTTNLQTQLKALKITDSGNYKGKLVNGMQVDVDQGRVSEDKEKLLKGGITDHDDDGFVKIPEHLVEPFRVTSKQIDAVRYVPECHTLVQEGQHNVCLTFEEKWFVRYVGSAAKSASIEVDSEEIDAILSPEFANHVKNMAHNSFVRVPVGQSRQKSFLPEYPGLVLAARCPHCPFPAR